MYFDVLRVGEKRPEWAIHEDSYRIEFDQYSGFQLYIFMRNIQANELAALRSDTIMATFEEISGVGFFAFEFGRAIRCDAPFNPALYQKDLSIEPVEEGTGYALNILVIDSETGELKNSRVIGLCHNISVIIREYFMSAISKNFNRAIHENIIKMVYSRFTTDQLMMRKTATVCII